MPIFINTSFKGFGRICTAAVVVAESAQQAADFLTTELAKEGPDAARAADMEVLPRTYGTVLILCDGDY